MFTAVIFVLFAFIAYWIYSVQPSKNEPPGPFRLPLLGNLLQFKKNAKQAHRYVENLSKTYGSIVSLKIGYYTVFVHDATIMQDAYLTRASDFEGRNFDFRQLIYCGFFDNYNEWQHSREEKRGILFAEGSTWKRNRKVAFSKIFTNSKVASLEDKIIGEIEFAVQVLKTFSKAGEKVLVTEFFKILSMNIITQMAFSQRIADPSKPMSEQGDLVKHLEKMVEFLAPGNPAVAFPFLRKLSSAAKKIENYKNDVKAIRTKLQEILESHKSSKKKISDDGDFVDVLLSEQVSDENITDDEVLTVMLDVILGGTDTSSNSISFLIGELVNRPEIQRKLQEEVDRVVGRSRSVRISDLPKMEYLDAVILELGRKYPAVPMNVTHTTTREGVTLGSYVLPKHTAILTNIWAFHHDSKVYKDPYEFNPNRFIENSNLKNHPGYVPFSAGSRICAGRNLAVTEMKLITANMLQNLNWKSSGKVDLTESIAITIHPSPYVVQVQERN